MPIRIDKVHELKYSTGGEHFLVISGTVQPKLYDRDGEEVCVISVIGSHDWHLTLVLEIVPLT